LPKALKVAMFLPGQAAAIDVGTSGAYKILKAIIVLT
jgi:hypothetical protein